MRSIHLVIVIVCLGAILLGILLGKRKSRHKQSNGGKNSPTGEKGRGKDGGRGGGSSPNGRKGGKSPHPHGESGGGSPHPHGGSPHPHGGSPHPHGGRGGSKTPIVLVPGLASSRLYGVWKNLKQLDSVEGFPNIAQYIEDHLKEFEHDFASPDCQANQDTWHRIWVDLSAAMPIPDYPDCWQKLAQTKYVPSTAGINKDPEQMNVNTFREAENSYYRKRHNFGGSTAWREEIPKDEISDYGSDGQFKWAGSSGSVGVKPVPPNPPITRDFGGLCGCKTLAALEEKDCIDLAPAGVFLTLVDYLTGKKGDILDPYEAPRFSRDAVGGECESGLSWCANPVDDTSEFSLCDCSGEKVMDFVGVTQPTKNSSASATNLNDITLVAAPYDWTKCLQRGTGIVSDNDAENEYLDIYFGHLKRLIEFQYWGNDGRRETKVCVASHSLGCVMIKIFLDWYLPRRAEVKTNPNFVQNWKDTFIDIWIPLAGPFAGAPKALKAVLSGDDEGLGAVCKAEVWRCAEKRNCMSWYQNLETQAAGLLMCCPDDIALKNLNVVTITDDTSNCSSAVVPKKAIGKNKIFSTDHKSVHDLLEFSDAVPGSVWLESDPTLIGSYYALAETWWGVVNPSNPSDTDCDTPGKPNTPLQYKKVSVPTRNNTCNSRNGTLLPTKESCANIMYTHPGVDCLHIYGSSTAAAMKTPISFTYGNYGDKPSEYNQYAPSATYEQDFYKRLLNPNDSIATTDIQKFLLNTKESVAVVTKNTQIPEFNCVSPSESIQSWMIGDGTVPWISLRVPEIWANENQKNGTKGTVMSLCLKGENFDHLGLISQEQTWLVMATQLGIKMKN